MFVLGLDTETTGLDPQKDCIIEIGAVLFDVSEGRWEPVDSFNALVYEHGYPELTDEIKKLTGIESLEGGCPLQAVMEETAKLAERADMLISHNAQFDRGMVIENLRRFKLELPVFEKKPWICSIDDIVENKVRKCKRLAHMALDCGVPVDPRTLHRAAADVELMGKMLSELRADPQGMFDYQTIPEIIVEIETPAPWTDGGKGVAAAKSAGFSWEKLDRPEVKVSKTWIKKIKETEFDELKLKCAPFPVLLNRRLV